MYDHWTDVPAAQPGTTAALDARDRLILVELLKELRELTLSRRSHAAATEYLRRLGGG